MTATDADEEQDILIDESCRDVWCDDVKNMTTTTTTDENPQKHLLIEKEENEETEIKKQKLTPSSDLTDEQLMAIFGEGPPFRFDLCNAFLIYDKTIKRHLLFGTIQAAVGGFSPDPFLQKNEKWARFKADLLEQLGDNIKSISRLPTTGKKKQAVKYIEDEAFHVCDDHAFITLSDKPNGGVLLCYVTLKYAVDADVEVYFAPPSKETKVRGRVEAYYGKGFNYDEPADFYYATLFQSEPDVIDACVKPGKLNLMRSRLAVPAKFSLIIKAELFDNTYRVKLLSGTYEFHVPRDGNSSDGSIFGNDCSLKLKVDWKLPFEEPKIPSSPLACSSNSSVSRLMERRKFDAESTSTMADPDERNRWSLQEEIEKVFNTSLERTFGGDHQETVSCSISTCTKEDSGDYLCSSVLHIWPKIKDTHVYKGPKHAGLAVKDIMCSEYKEMMERCVVCGPGFVKIKLSRKWIAKGKSFYDPLISKTRDSLKETGLTIGNTAVYLQLTHVRICSIIRNSSKDIKELTPDSDELILKNDDERELGLHLLRFTEVVGEACTILTPHILCEYLYDLCKRFNSLNSSVCQVVGSTEETSNLLLCKATEVHLIFEIKLVHLVNIVQISLSWEYSTCPFCGDEHGMFLSTKYRTETLFWYRDCMHHLVVAFTHQVTWIFMDTSQWMCHNQSHRFLEQADAIELYCKKKLRSHPDNHVGIFATGQTGFGSVRLNLLEIFQRSHEWHLKTAMHLAPFRCFNLTIEHKNKGPLKRILVFAGGYVDEDANDDRNGDHTCHHVNNNSNNSCRLLHLSHRLYRSSILFLVGEGGNFDRKRRRDDSDDMHGDGDALDLGGRLYYWGISLDVVNFGTHDKEKCRILKDLVDEANNERNFDHTRHHANNNNNSYRLLHLSRRLYRSSILCLV
ncbi:arginine--tRNA ligase, chloroplastic/mitochondrial [Artemisia annua]|uniref:arginine--tRNA ligase n=1 Tax=Artemisia annua TaxID=35608 RepID=A0A2U1QIT9_ARTAN|nr:arginine--tRNA ligase, chloroplastic/mitochondrial [Artemisia annua]